MTFGKSKYLDKVKQLVSEKAIHIHGARLLVEVLDEIEQKTKTGIILASTTNKTNTDEGQLAVVLAVGEGYTDPDDSSKFIDLYNKVGDVVIVNKFTLKHCSEVFTVGDKDTRIALADQAAVHATVGNLEMFMKVLHG